MPPIKLIRRLHREQLLNKLYKEFHSRDQQLSPIIRFRYRSGMIRLKIYAEEVFKRRN